MHNSEMTDRIYAFFLVADTNNLNTVNRKTENMERSACPSTHSPDKTIKDNAPRTRLKVGKEADRCIVYGMTISSAMLRMLHKSFSGFS